MDCCNTDTILGYIICFVNFVFFLASLPIIGIGAYILLTMKDFKQFDDNISASFAIILIVLGAVVMIVAFFGCCGACTENPCEMYTYGTLLALIFVALIGVTVTFVIFKDEIERTVKDKMKKSIDKYNNSTTGDIKKIWDWVQKDVKCCGVETYMDWNRVMEGEHKVPDSCCKVETEGCGKAGFFDTEKIYTEGCLVTLKTKILENSGHAIGVGVGIGILNFLGVIVGCRHAKTLKKKKEILPQ